MPAWVTVYCAQRVAHLSPDDILAGLRGRDEAALAGVDYWSLAEDYEIDPDLVDSALAQLRVVRVGSAPLDYEVHHATEGRPLVLHGWTDAERVREEIEEALEDEDATPAIIRAQVSRAVEIVGIELGFSNFEDMGVVLAYELARYLAQKADGVIRSDEDRWLRVIDGAFELADEP
jgi:hypothetical protein